MPDYLKSGWMENVDAASVEEFRSTASRRRAATASGEEWSFRMFAVRFGSDVYRFIFAAKTMTAQVDRSFRESVTSFRRMSLKESQQIHPLHLKIVTARAGDTVEKLARRMATAITRSTASACSTVSRPRDRIKAGREGEDRRGVTASPRLRLRSRRFGVEREFARHIRPPEIERILRLVVGGRPALFLRDVVDVAGIFRETAPRIAHVVEVVGAEHVTAETPAFGPALVVHAHGAEPDIVDARDVPTAMMEAGRDDFTNASR